MAKIRYTHQREGPDPDSGSLLLKPMRAHLWDNVLKFAIKHIIKIMTSTHLPLCKFTFSIEHQQSRMEDWLILQVHLSKPQVNDTEMITWTDIVYNTFPEGDIV